MKFARLLAPLSSTLVLLACASGDTESSTSSGEDGSGGDGGASSTTVGTTGTGTSTSATSSTATSTSTTATSTSATTASSTTATSTGVTTAGTATTGAGPATTSTGGGCDELTCLQECLMQFAQGMCVGGTCVCEGIIPSSSISFMNVEPPSADSGQAPFPGY